MTGFTREELSRYLEGELPAARTRELTDALARDSTLQKELEALRALGAAARELAETNLPPGRDLWPAIHSRIGAARRRPIWPLLAATLLLGTLLGLGVGFAWFAVPSRATPQGQRFLLLLHEGKGMQQATSASEQLQVNARYRSWAVDLRRRGNLELGEKLHDREGFDLRADGDHERTGTQDVGGLFILIASDYDQARSIARTCPHLARGGTIELRRIHDT